jgi:hypothetical protein
MKILKKDVDNALSAMELRLFGQTQEHNPNMPTVLRFLSLFAEAYHVNSYPEESILLRESYSLLKSKGYYYTEE